MTEQMAQWSVFKPNQLFNVDDDDGLGDSHQ